MIERVRQYYNQIVDAESNRLSQGLCAVEFASTLRLIGKYFPPTGRICDIGSGPGRYSLELTRMGYHVTLFDLADGVLVRARQEFAKAGLDADAFVLGTATDLSCFSDRSYHAALMLGPLIHLTATQDRRQALRELCRILVPGGTAIVSYLNSWGLMRTGLTDFPARYRNPDSLRSMLSEQTFEGELRGFTDCCWSTPPAALAEVESEGFTVLTYAGVEGFAGGMNAIIDRLSKEDPQAYESVLQVAPETSELPQYRDATDHLHIIVRVSGNGGK